VDEAQVSPDKLEAALEAKHKSVEALAQLLRLPSKTPG